MKFSIKNIFSKCDQIRRKLWIWLHLLKQSLMQNFIFCAVIYLGRKFLNFKKEKKKKEQASLLLKKRACTLNNFATYYNYNWSSKIDPKIT